MGKGGGGGLSWHRPPGKISLVNLLKKGGEVLEALSRVGGLKRRRGYTRCGGNPAILLVAGSFISSEPPPQSCSLLLAFQQKYSHSVTKGSHCGTEDRIGYSDRANNNEAM